ncbi:LysR family transcriptional regulator [uncultured Methylobacterium sp.]|jgi:DNA-binding transcriptional LysR family regulator|uniref:LysR family transcriptional regulator n=1 Tax=uncultured Methylobacterium sp. TaxID=157278 RepID=UPI002639A7BF|nr:LysR family transcriptional regulator [uncultured Methylobacterium sp.]
MELRHLRYFAAAVREGSVTRAAKKLNIAQPPLSRQIQKLEEEVGVALLQRGSRPLKLTDAGHFFYEHALNILDRAEALKMMTRRVGQIGQGRFGIGVVGSILYGPLPDMIRRFHATYPHVDIELVELTSTQQINALKKGEIDIGFGRLHGTDSAIQQEVLVEEPLVVALPIGHSLLDHAGPVRLAELMPHRLIIYPSGPRPSYADQVLSILQGRGLKPQVVREVSELQTALGLVAAAVGVSLVPAAVQRLRRDDVVYRLLEDDAVTSPIIMFSRLHDSSREIGMLLQLVRDVYQKWDAESDLIGRREASAGEENATPNEE